MLNASAATGSAASVSVVICAYSAERWIDLRDAVASVQAQRAPAKEVIVVVDHNAALADRARETFGDGVRVLENSRARGLSGARNTGLACAGGEIIAFLDDDATASPDWLERLASWFSDDAVVAAGGRIDARWVEGRPSWFPPEFDWVVGCSYVGLPAEAAHVRNVIGANMAFRRSTFDAVGTFTDGIGRIGRRPLGCEETELCIRARRVRADAIVVYDPRARVRHTVPPERATWTYFLERCYSEGLSKAQVAASVGGRDGLATERSYATTVLPRAVWSGVRGAVRYRDAAALARSAAVTAGLASAAAGYAVGRLRSLAPSRLRQGRQLVGRAVASEHVRA